MVKSLRFLVILIAVAVFSIASFAQSSWAAADTGEFVLQPTSATKCDKSDTVYVSKQFLPSVGFVATSKGIVDTNQTVGIIPELNKLYTGAVKDVRLTFILKNGTFADSKLKLIIDNQTGAPKTVTKTVIAGTKVIFTLDNSTLGLSNITKIALVDQTAADNATLSIKVNGGLQNGQAVGLNLTSESSTDGQNYKTFTYGCFDKVLYLVENQWTAKLCRCQTCTNGSGVDTDNLVATANGITVQDAQLKVSGVSYYDACIKKNDEGGGECCNSVPSSCNLFCNEQEGTGITVESKCSMPATCWEDCGVYKGLKIFENQDLAATPYKITNLATATITFTLTGNLKNIASIALTQANAPTFTPLGTFVINDNGTAATASISGETLFVKTNGGTQFANNAPIYFSVKITPKANAALMPNSFNLSATISGGTLENDAYLDWGNFLNWQWSKTANAVKVAALYSGGGYETYINLFSDSTATVSAVVTTADGSKAVVNLGSIEPGQKFMKTATDIVNAVEALGYNVYKANGVYQFTADLIVSTTGSIDGYAVIVQPGAIGSLRVPLYNNTQGFDQ